MANEPSLGKRDETSKADQEAGVAKPKTGKTFNQGTNSQLDELDREESANKK